MEAGVSLAVPDRVRRLQATLHAQAKQELEFRCYTRSDKVWREDVLQAAGHTVLTGSNRADSGSVSAGTDLQGRSATGAIRLPGWMEAWLEMAVEEDDGQDGQRRTNRARRERK